MLETQTLTVFKADSRGQQSLEWLESRHSFSFGGYHNPMRMQHGCLRVINEDWIQPESGFSTHSHKDMEIVTYVISGELQHKDSMGNASIISAGYFQRMSAGTGIRHSEFNASSESVTHLLQIWFLPKQLGVTPGYQEQIVKNVESSNQWGLMVSPGGVDDSLSINQDVSIFMARLNETLQNPLPYTINEGRKGWVQLISGQCILNGIALSAGDGVAIEANTALHVYGAVNHTEVLLFDMV